MPGHWVKGSKGNLRSPKIIDKNSNKKKLTKEKKILKKTLNETKC